jgi:hypothetical protein
VYACRVNNLESSGCWIAKNEITAVTPSKARAFRRLGAATAVQGAPVNKVILVGSLFGDNTYEGVLHARLRRYLDRIVELDGLTDSETRTAWARDSSLLRAAVLRRWLGELRGQALLRLGSATAASGADNRWCESYREAAHPVGRPPKIA